MLFSGFANSFALLYSHNAQKAPILLTSPQLEPFRCKFKQKNDTYSKVQESRKNDYTRVKVKIEPGIKIEPCNSVNSIVYDRVNYALSFSCSVVRLYNIIQKQIIKCEENTYSREQHKENSRKCEIQITEYKTKCGNY